MIYDLIILGGGPAGYLAAERAGHEGMTVLLIEKRFIGGVCLNEGCIPSKALLYSAKVFDNAKNGAKYGITAGELKLDHAVVIQRKNKVVRTLVSGIKAQLKKNGVVVVEAEGKVAGRNAEGYIIAASGQQYTAKQLLIATGSIPILPPIAGLAESCENGFALTNREILDLDMIPGNLVIVGGGVIGLEMASYFNSAGSKVIVVEMLDHIAGNTDGEISDILMKNYKKKGVDFRLGCKVVKISANDGVTYEKDGQVFTVPADKVLVSIGRKPYTSGLGFETIGLELEKDRVKTDNRGRTNLPGVYAAGDVNGTSMLAHTAYREAEVCVNNMAGRKDLMRYIAIPSVIYTNPEVASVGETEESAAEKGIQVETAKISMMYSGRYVAENEGGDGICKVLAEKGSGRILGVHMICNYASEIIYGAGLIIETGIRVKDLRELVFPHPTVCEIIREAIFSKEF